MTQRQYACLSNTHNLIRLTRNNLGQHHLITWQRSPTAVIYFTLQECKSVARLLLLHLLWLLLVPHSHLRLVHTRLWHPLLRHPKLLLLHRVPLLLLSHVASIGVVQLVGVGTTGSERPRDSTTHSWRGEGVVVHSSAVRVPGKRGLWLHDLDRTSTGQVLYHADEYLHH